MPKVSIIIPCYNHGEYLDDAVGSVLNQTFKDLEIIIVNDGSTDEKTIEILKNFNKPNTKIINTTNQGLATARNTGIKNSSGKYILPLDADDMINQHYLEKAVNILENNENTGIVGPTTEFFGTQKGYFDIPKYKFPDILAGNCLVCSCLFRRDDWEKVGGYNPNMIYGWEDWDFWLSIIELGRDVYQIDEVMFYYRKHDTSMITNLIDEKQNSMINQIIKNHIDLYLHNKPEMVKLFQLNLKDEVDLKKIKKYKFLFNFFLSVSILLFIIIIIIFYYKKRIGII